MSLQEDAGITEEGGLRRDQWGRPLLIPKGEPESPLRAPDTHGRVPYTRASGLADYANSTKVGLEVWKRRLAARGVGEREDIAALIAALPPLGEGKEYAASNRATNELLDSYIEMALEHAGAHHKANHGTALHAFTVQDGGLFPPERMKADIAAYEAELDRLGIEPLADELFVANDGLWAAGTFDHLYALPDGRVVVGDKKTGIDHLIDAAVQMAVYSHADFYDTRSDLRMSLHEFVENNFGSRFDPNEGLHVAIPAGKGTCTITRLNLEEGHKLAEVAAYARTARLSSETGRFIVSGATPTPKAAPEPAPEPEWTATSAVEHAKTLQGRKALEDFVFSLPEPLRSERGLSEKFGQLWRNLPQ